LFAVTLHVNKTYRNIDQTNYNQNCQKTTVSVWDASQEKLWCSVLF